MSRQSTTINPSNVPEPQPQFSQVNTFTFQPGDKLIAITGQLAIQPNPSDPVPTGFEDQVRLALQNLENCKFLTASTTNFMNRDGCHGGEHYPLTCILGLTAAGATKRDIFKVTHHVVDFDYESKTRQRCS